MKQHGDREHAMLSASGSHRWMHCTPSVMLEEQYGVQGDTSYADEGTKAHELAEMYIQSKLLGTPVSEDDIARVTGSEYYDVEMERSVQMYVDTIAEVFEEAKKSDPLATLMTEQRVDLRQWVPESFGTTDCTIIANGKMYVIDLKYGKGVRVDAENNPQLRLYALGSWDANKFYYDITSVQTMIIQPRLDHVSTEEISIDDLKEWAEKEVFPAAQQAFHGLGELKSGDWCQFCKVRSRCRKLYEENIENAKLCFGADQRLMTDEQIAEVVLRGESIMGWIKAVQEYAELQAINENKKFEGLKLVRGRSMRKWIDTDKAFQTILSRFPELSADQISVTKLSGIGDIEKLVGKKVFEQRLADLTIKPEGALKLVSADDKRPEATNNSVATEVFND